MGLSVLQEKCPTFHLLQGVCPTSLHLQGVCHLFYPKFSSFPRSRVPPPETLLVRDSLISVIDIPSTSTVLRDPSFPVPWFYAIHFYLFYGSMRFIFTYFMIFFSYSMVLHDSDFHILMLNAIHFRISMVLRDSDFHILWIYAIYFRLFNGLSRFIFTYSLVQCDSF